jgi:hypothetical protein
VSTRSAPATGRAGRPRLAVLVGAVLLTTACTTQVTGDAWPEGAAPAGAGSPAVITDPVEWVDEVCGAMLEFSNVLLVPPAPAGSDPAEAVGALSGFLSSASDAATRAVSGLEAAGPSPVDGGDEIVADLTETLTRFAAAFGEARTRLDAVDPSDPQALASGFPEALGPLAEAEDLPDSTADLSAIPELDRAADQAPRCQELENK